MLYIFLGYAAIEIAAFWAMAHFLGFLWALFITVAVMAVGWAVLTARIRSYGVDLRTAMRANTAPESPVGNAALFAASATLTIVPGAVSTILALLLLAKPVRKVAGPVVTVVAMRRVMTMTQRAGVGAPAGSQFGGNNFGGNNFGGSPFGTGYVEGTVEDVVDGPTSTVDDITVRNPDGTVHFDIPEVNRKYDDPRSA